MFKFKKKIIEVSNTITFCKTAILINCCLDAMTIIEYDLIYYASNNCLYIIKKNKKCKFARKIINVQNCLKLENKKIVNKLQFFCWNIIEFPFRFNIYLQKKVKFVGILRGIFGKKNLYTQRAQRSQREKIEPL